MKSYNIALIPGDGTGPEVLAEGVKVLDAACAKHGVKLNYTSFDFGGERYKRTGEILPDSAIEEFKKFDSMFLGAIGHPDVKPGILEVGILLKTRFALDQYINLRPVTVGSAKLHLGRIIGCVDERGWALALSVPSMCRIPVGWTQPQFYGCTR